MILFRYLLPLLLALAVPCWGQTITLPESLSGAVGQPVTVKADTDGEIVRWRAIDPGLFMIDPELLKTTKAISVWSLKPGKYRLIAWTAKGDVPSPEDECVIVVGDPGPDPPGPDPNPPDPEPELSELGKKVRDWAKAVGNKTEAKQIAENYAGVNAAIAAGAYNGLADWSAQRSKVVSDLYEKNHKISENNEGWNKFFSNLSAEMRLLDETGKLANLPSLLGVLKSIQEGLEAVK